MIVFGAFSGYYVLMLNQRSKSGGSSVSEDGED